MACRTACGPCACALALALGFGLGGCVEVAPSTNMPSTALTIQGRLTPLAWPEVGRRAKSGPKSSNELAKLVTI